MDFKDFLSYYEIFSNSLLEDTDQKIDDQKKIINSSSLDYQKFESSIDMPINEFNVYFPNQK